MTLRGMFFMIGITYLWAGTRPATESAHDKISFAGAFLCVAVLLSFPVEWAVRWLFRRWQARRTAKVVLGPKPEWHPQSWMDLRCSCPHPGSDDTHARRVLESSRIPEWDAKAKVVQAEALAAPILASKVRQQALWIKQLKADLAFERERYRVVTQILFEENNGLAIMAKADEAGRKAAEREKDENIFDSRDESGGRG